MSIYLAQREYCSSLCLQEAFTGGLYTVTVYSKSCGCPRHRQCRRDVSSRDFWLHCRGGDNNTNIDEPERSSFRRGAVVPQAIHGGAGNRDRARESNKLPSDRMLECGTFANVNQDGMVSLAPTVHAVLLHINKCCCIAHRSAVDARPSSCTGKGVLQKSRHFLRLVCRFRIHGGVFSPRVVFGL